MPWSFNHSAGGRVILTRFSGACHTRQSKSIELKISKFSSGSSTPVPYIALSGRLLNFELYLTTNFYQFTIGFHKNRVNILQ